MSIVVEAAREYKDTTNINKPVKKTGARPLLSRICPPNGRIKRAEKVKIPTIKPTQVSDAVIS